jgi:hypothetical protein
LYRLDTIVDVKQVMRHSVWQQRWLLALKHSWQWPMKQWKPRKEAASMQDKAAEIPTTMMSNHQTHLFNEVLCFRFFV